MIKFVKLVEVYPAGVTTKTFTHEIINDDSVIEVYTEDANIYPIATTQSGNTVTISIVDHDEPVEVCVTVNNMVSYSEPITSSDVFDPIFGSVSSALLHYEEVKQNNLIAGSGITIGGITGSEISADVTAGDLATVSDEVSAIKESLTQYEQSGFLSRNLFNDYFELGVISSSTGKNSSSSTAIRSVGSTEVKPNTTYTVDLFNEADIHEVYTYQYDASGNYISRLTTPTFTTNSNTRFVRFCSTKTTDLTTKLQLEEGTVAHDWTPYAPSNSELKQSLNQLASYSGIQTLAGASYVHYWKRGDIVTVTSELDNTELTKNAWTQIGILPENYRPPRNIQCNATFGSGLKGIGAAQILTSGVVRYFTSHSDSDKGIIFTITY